MTWVAIRGKHFKRVAIAGDIAASQSLIVMTHFKGHMDAGFGGAIKYLAMGCAPSAGKREQHQVHPFTLKDRCIGCGKCVPTCPECSIRLVRKKSVITKHRCIGCFESMTICPEHAIEIDWITNIPQFVERLVEYALGAVKGKTGRGGISVSLPAFRQIAIVCHGVMRRLSLISAFSLPPIRSQSMQRVLHS
jgi:uncharacterized Fe-S center protein